MTDARVEEGRLVLDVSVGSVLGIQLFIQQSEEDTGVGQEEREDESVQVSYSCNLRNVNTHDGATETVFNPAVWTLMTLDVVLVSFSEARKDAREVIEARKENSNASIPGDGEASNLFGLRDGVNVSLVDVVFCVGVEGVNTPLEINLGRKGKDEDGLHELKDCGHEMARCQPHGDFVQVLNLIVSFWELESLLRGFLTFGWTRRSDLLRTFDASIVGRVASGGKAMFWTRKWHFAA